MKKIGIVGAGISGLVLACFLKKNKNYDISVYEKDDIYLPNSNGIQISPNALRILKKINFDLFDQKKLCKITGLSFYDYNLNAKIARMSFDYLKNDPYITLNRNELINFLINQFSLKDNIIIKEVININDKSIFFKNDSEEKFDTLIVADGIFSKLRPEKIQPVYSGYSALRGVFTDTIQVNDIDLWMGKNFHLVKYPIDQNKNFSFTLVKKMPFVKVVDGYDSKFKDINKNNNFYFPKFDNMTFDNIKVKIWPIYKLNKIFYGHNDIYFIWFVILSCDTVDFKMSIRRAAFGHFETEPSGVFCSEPRIRREWFLGVRMTFITRPGIITLQNAFRVERSRRLIKQVTPPW